MSPHTNANRYDVRLSRPHTPQACASSTLPEQSGATSQSNPRPAAQDLGKAVPIFSAKAVCQLTVKAKELQEEVQKRKKRLEEKEAEHRDLEDAIAHLESHFDEITLRKKELDEEVQNVHDTLEKRTRTRMRHAVILKRVVGLEKFATGHCKARRNSGRR